MNLDTIRHNGYLFAELRVCCSICHINGLPTSKISWTHLDKGCGHKMFLGENGFLLCKSNHDDENKCMGYAPITEWIFNCTDCGKPDLGQGFSIRAKKDGIISMGLIISMAGQLVDETGIDWLSALINNLKKQISNFISKSRTNGTKDNTL